MSATDHDQQRHASGAGVLADRVLPNRAAQGAVASGTGGGPESVPGTDAPADARARVAEGAIVAPAVAARSAGTRSAGTRSGMTPAPAGGAAPAGVDAPAPGRGAEPGAASAAGGADPAAAAALAAADLRLAAGLDHIPLDHLRAFAGAARLSADHARDLGTAVSAAVAEDRRALHDRRVAEVRGWVEAVQARPDFAGERELVNRFLLDHASPAFIRDLNASGHGARPAVFDFLLGLARRQAGPPALGPGRAGFARSDAEHAREEYAAMWQERK